MNRLVSNIRWRRTPNSNIEPQSMTGRTSGAPGTFSITYGTPAALRRARVGAIRSGCSAGCALPQRVVIVDQRWHGGLAQMKSNPSSGNVIASAWWKASPT
jgi:hypothetical protein